MTTQLTSPALREGDACPEHRFVFSRRDDKDFVGDAPASSQPIGRFKTDAAHVKRRCVTVAPAGVAALALLCVSVAACRHATGHPLDRIAGTPQEHSDVLAPNAPTTHTARASRQGGRTTVKGTRATAAQKKHAGSATNTTTAASSPGDLMQAAIPGTVPAPHADEASLAMTDDDPNAAGGHPSATATPPRPSVAASAAAAAGPLSVTLPLPLPARGWQSWAAPATVTVIVSVALLAFVRYRRARKRRANNGLADATVIGWKGWSYALSRMSRPAFFGADSSEVPRGWAIDHLQLDDWAKATAPSTKPVMDGRYGRVQPVRPPRIDLSLDDAAFLDWAADGHVASSVGLPRLAYAGHATSPIRRVQPQPAVEAAGEASDHTEASSEAPTNVEGYESASPVSDEITELVALAAVSPSPTPTQANAEDATNAQRLQALSIAVISGSAGDLAPTTRNSPRLPSERQEIRAKQAAQRDALRLQEDRRQALAREATQQQALRQDAQREDAVGEAKRCLTAGHPAKALDALAPALVAPHASGEAWTVAGWCWWRMARDNVPAAEGAVTKAIDAFQQAILVEPDREAMLGRALIRCHLFLADRLHGEERAARLDAALSLMDNAAAPRRGGDAKFVAEHASALHERALLSNAEDRASRLEQAQALLSNLPTDDVDADARWLQVTLCLAQAQQVNGRAADTLLSRAADVLGHAPADAAPDVQDNWLARLIDVELLRVRTLSAAARLMRLRQLRDTYTPRLAQAHTILPLLSWLHVLREWARMLSEQPAREKLAEAEALFERMERLSPDDIGSMHFARAYYLRLRSAHETISTALDTLDKADALLAKTRSPVLSPETIALERAEVALARAPLLDPPDRRAALLRAMGYADVATTVEDGNLPRALTCALAARVTLFDLIKPSHDHLLELADLAWRLLSAAPYEPEAVRLSARGELIAGNAEIASQLCEMAWDVGCRDTALLRLWRESLTSQPNTLADAANDPQWKRLNQCIRLAQSIGQAMQ